MTEDDTQVLLARIDERTQVLITQMEKMTMWQDQVGPQIIVLTSANILPRLATLEKRNQYMIGGIGIMTFLLVAFGRIIDVANIIMSYFK